MLAREAVVGAAESGRIEAGFEFLAVETGIELASSAGELLERDVAAIEGGEVKGRPFAVRSGGFEAFVE